MRYISGGMLLVILLAGTAGAQTTRTVGAGGSLQAALDSALPGDTILLEAGATFVGNFVLRNKAGAAFITVRSSAADASLPGPGQRITPEYAALLPKIRSGNSMSALVTAAGAHHWRLLFLELQGSYGGYGEIVRLGTTDATSLSDQPTDIVIDRCYVHGDPVQGQKNGIAMHSRTTDIINSYVSDIKGIGQETHAIIGANGPGPYTISNNYLEAAGINFMLGGIDPKIVNNVPGMVPGANGYGVTVTRNHIRKNPAWRQPFVPTPSGVGATASPGGGTLPGGTYAYRVAARLPSYGTTATSAASAEASASVDVGTTGSVTVTWQPVPNATRYRVHGRTAGSQNVYFEVAAGTACAASLCQFVDAGAVGTAGAVGGGTRWAVKNLLELKIGENVLIEGNLLENNWVGTSDQPGYGMLLRSNPATDTGAPWTVVQNVTIRRNILRHSPGGVNVVGVDGGSGTRLAVRANNIAVTNNLLIDISPSAWGGGNPRVFNVAGANDVTIDHNTVVSAGPGLLLSHGAIVSNGFVFTNNISRRGTYGVKGDSEPEGTGTLTHYFPGAQFRRNAVFGAPGQYYPTDNYYPALSLFDGQFVSLATADYHLSDASPYKRLGTDGRDLGADVDAVMAAAEAPGAPGVPEVPELSIEVETESVGGGVVGTDYAATLIAKSGVTPYYWSVAAGALPAGLSLSASGAISGVPSAAGTFSFTALVQDSASSSATRVFSIAVAPPLQIQTDALPSGVVNTTYAAQVTAVNGTAPFEWSLGAGSLPQGLALDAGTGLIVGTPSVDGSFAFTAIVRDATGALASRAFSIVIELKTVAPDLTVSALTVPAVANAGAAITVTDTTKNQRKGKGAVAAASQTAFYLSTNVLFDAADVRLGSRPVSPLDSGAVSSAATLVTIPGGITSGTYYILAKADAGGVVSEDNEVNNLRAASVRIGADMTVTALTVPGTGAAGSGLAISDTTTNAGGGAAAASVTRFYLSANTVLDTGDPLLGGRAVPVLSGGASHTASSLVTIPAATVGGVYYVIALADADGTVTETSEANNSRTAGLLKIGADLTVSLATLPPAGAGGSVLVTDTTRNQGVATADATSTAFYLSTNTVRDAADVLLGSRAVPGLAPNATHAASTVLQIPAATPTGSYYLLAMADAGGGVAEANELNNTAAMVLRVGPDLVVSAFTASPGAVSGAAVTVTDTVTNQGGGGAAGSATTFYLSINGSLDTSDTRLGARPAGSLDTGAADSGSTELTLPAGLPTATYYLIAVADGDAQVIETTEINNWRPMLLYVTAAP